MNTDKQDTTTHESMPIPAGREYDLHPYGPVLFDGYCGEPIAWGFRIRRRLSESEFNSLSKYGSLECVSFGNWVVVTKWLTIEEARKKYGQVTAMEHGPRGGFRSVTYGTKIFLSKRLDPGYP